jgi:hypothetical protein
MYITIYNKGEQLDHIEKFHKKQHIRHNLDEYLISQVFHNNFIPCKLNPDSSEIYEENFWDEKIQCIYEDCQYPIQGYERGHIADLLSGSELEPTEFQKLILEGMNPIWRYLVISEIRKKHRHIIGDMRLANFKINPDRKIHKQGKGWTYQKKKSKNDFEIDNRIPIGFRARKWIIAQNQINKAAEYIEVNRVQNETRIIEEKLKQFGNKYDDIIDYLFKNWLIVQNLRETISEDTALKFSIYAIYYAYKLNDLELMETIVREQHKRKWNGFIVMARCYTINKYSKVGLSNFKAKCSEESVQNWIKEEDIILKETNDDIRNLFYLMKRKCGDYVYRANLIWENLVNTKASNADNWFNQYAKTAREFHNENWEN